MAGTKATALTNIMTTTRIMQRMSTWKKIIPTKRVRMKQMRTRCMRMRVMKVIVCGTRRMPTSRMGEIWRSPRCSSPTVPRLPLPPCLGRSTSLARCKLPRRPSRSLGVLQLVGVGMTALGAFAWVLVATAGLSIFAALYGSLRARRGELAMLRCLGATRLELLGYLIVEGLVMSLLGVALGFLAGHVPDGARSACGLRARAAVVMTGWTWVATETWLLLGLLLVGAASAVIPAIQAYRTDGREDAGGSMKVERTVRAGLWLSRGRAWLALCCVVAAGAVAQSADGESASGSLTLSEMLAEPPEDAVSNLDPIAASEAQEIVLEGVFEFGYQDEQGRFFIDLLELDKAYLGVRVTTPDGRPVVGAKPEISIEGTSSLLLSETESG